MSTTSKKTCFVIGPMGEGQLERLKWLAAEIVQPVLGEDYVVFTPDVNEIGNIMHHVIRSCDRAELVVADTTGNNPNVFYEMAILDAMGRALIPVKFKIEEKKEAMPFDRALYRIFELTQDKTSAQATLKAVIEQVQAQRDAGKLFENPITDYFDNPLNSLASARGLARGYFLNLITPSLKGEIVEGPKHAVGKSHLKVQTILPIRLGQTTRDAVDKVSKQGRLETIEIEAPGRKITSYVWANHHDANGDPIIVDIPTTMASLLNNVDARLGRGTMRERNSPEYRALEDDEIAQFIRYLTIFRNQKVNSENPGLVEDNYRIISVADCFEPDLLG